MTQEPRPRLVSLYEEMYQHTKNECRYTCTKAGSCCDGAVCEAMIQHAEDEWDVTLERTGHPTLPLMGPDGCTAAPHLRPLCTVHTCEIGSSGKKKGPGGDEWTERYFELRGEISEIEGERMFSSTRWHKLDNGCVERDLSSGLKVWLGTSDMAFPPGAINPPFALNRTSVWMRLFSDHGDMGWWASLPEQSLHKVRGQIDRNGYTVPDEFMVVYWRTRAVDLEQRLRALGEEV